MLSSLRIQAGRATIAGEPFRAEFEGGATFEAEIDEDTLQEFVASRVPQGIQVQSVSLVPGEIHVRASVRMLIELSAVAVCVLRVEDGTRVFVDALSVDALGGGATGMVQRQLDEVNPVLDVSGLPFSVKLSGVEVAAGRILVKGTAKSA